MTRINFTSGQHIESGWERATTRWDSRGGMREGTESGVGLIPQEPKANVFAGSIYGPPGNNAGSGLKHACYSLNTLVVPVCLFADAQQKGSPRFKGWGSLG